MTVFIKSIKSFKTVAAVAALTPSLCIDAIDAEKSSVVVKAADLPQALVGSWAIIDGHVYLIDSISPANGTSKLALLPAIEFFSRTIIYSAPRAGTSTGAFIAAALVDNYSTPTDSVYALPYLNVTTLDSASDFIQPEVSDYGTFDLLSYMRTVRQLAYVTAEVSCDNDHLYIQLAVDPPADHIVIAGSNGDTLASASFSGSTVAKITTLQRIETGEKDANGDKVYSVLRADWYLATDGSVSPTPPASRAEGTWEVQTVSGNQDSYTKALERFRKNSRAHKIEFYSSRRFKVLDNIALRTGGEVINTVVTCITAHSGDARTLYRCGSLAVTAVDKLKEVHHD